jgi:hypothetical protein
MTLLCYTAGVKTYVHARLSRGEREALDKLKAATGRSESDLVRLGVRLAADGLGAGRTALDLAGDSVGRFPDGPPDLSTNKTHLEGFGR